MIHQKKSIFVIHTSFVSVDHLKALFTEIIPEAIVNHIVDDSLLADVTVNGKITPAIVRRICFYAQSAEARGADLVVNQCSSVGEAVNIARATIGIPYIKIDEPMAAEAVRLGHRIAVIATVASTVKPSVGLVKEAATAAGKEIVVNEYLVDGAMEILIKEGNREKHNKLVLAAIEKAQLENDVIVLAQGSMVVLLPLLGKIKIPVLSSPRLGVENAKRVLGLL